MKCKVGLEIHQRLNTRKKLFCNCPTTPTKKIFEIKRKLHPVRSELGKIDFAAQLEELRDKEFIYEIYEDGVCDVCCDEEPPHEINKEALNLALKTCKIFDAEIVDEINVMRKIVIDGSTPMSFQRTMIVGMNGKINTSFGEVGIPTICLEEESAGIIGEVERAETGVFNLSRLGIPLVEIATEPVSNGKEAREVAERIGLSLRVNSIAMRGIGTIRQDVNISIEGGARVEIKGLQELDLIEKVVENEVNRQVGLMRICKKIEERIKGKKVESRIYDVTDIFKGTGCNFIREGIWRGQKLYCLLLKEMNGILGEEIFKGYRYGTELNGYVKRFGFGIIHSDEDLSKYGFGSEIKELEKRIGRRKEDAFVLSLGDERCKNALEFLSSRVYLTRVPEETRHALLDGKSEYLRPLPGAARLYPETDVPFVKINREIYEKMKVIDYDEIKKELEKSLGKDLTEKMLRSEKLNLFLKLREIVDEKIVAVTLEETLKSIKREGYNIENIKDERIEEVLISYKEGLITRAAIPEILIEISKKDEKVEKLIDKLKLRKLNKKEIKEIVKKVGKNFEKIMREYRLIIDPKDLKEVMEE